MANGYTSWSLCIIRPHINVRVDDVDVAPS